MARFDDDRDYWKTNADEKFNGVERDDQSERVANSNAFRKPRGVKTSRPMQDMSGHAQRTHVTDLHTNLPGTPRVVDDGTVANHQANTAAKEDHARLLRKIHLDDRLSGRYDEKGTY